MTNYDQVILDYTKAIELNPRCFKAYYNRGNAYERKGEYDLAISDFTKVNFLLDLRGRYLVFNLSPLNQGDTPLSGDCT